MAPASPTAPARGLVWVSPLGLPTVCCTLAGVCFTIEPGGRGNDASNSDSEPIGVTGPSADCTRESDPSKSSVVRLFIRSCQKVVAPSQELVGVGDRPLLRAHRTHCPEFGADGGKDGGGGSGGGGVFFLRDQLRRRWWRTSTRMRRPRTFTKAVRMAPPFGRGWRQRGWRLIWRWRGHSDSSVAKAALHLATIRRARGVRVARVVNGAFSFGPVIPREFDARGRCHAEIPLRIGRARDRCRRRSTPRSTPRSPTAESRGASRGGSRAPRCKTSARPPGP